MEARLTLSLILCLTFPSQTTISYQTTAKRVPVVLQELEARLRRKLSSDAVFKNEVLILRADSVPAQDLLDRIADVATGKWEKDRDRLILRPDAAKRKEQETERMALRVKKVSTLLEKMRKEIEPEFDLGFLEEAVSIRKTDLQNGFFRSARRTPTSRFALRCLISLGAERLAKIEPGDRLVLSTRPTRMQSPIPDREKNLTQYFKEDEVYRLAKAGDRERYSVDSTSGGQRNRKSSNQKLELIVENFEISVGDLVVGPPRISVRAIAEAYIWRYEVPLYENTLGTPAVTSDEPETPLKVSEERCN